MRAKLRNSFFIDDKKKVLKKIHFHAKFAKGKRKERKEYSYGLLCKDWSSPLYVRGDFARRHGVKCRRIQKCIFTQRIQVWALA